MKKHELKDYNRLLRAENEALKYILQEAEDSLSDGYQCGLSKLLNDRNDELIDDINDIQADWAVERIVLAKVIKEYDSDLALSDMTLREFERDIDDLTRHRDRFHGIIKELKKEKYDMGVELEKLKKENAELGAKALDNKEIKANLLNEVFSLKEKIRSMESQR